MMGMGGGSGGSMAPMHGQHLGQHLGQQTAYGHHSYGQSQYQPLQTTQTQSYGQQLPQAPQHHQTTQQQSHHHQSSTQQQQQHHHQNSTPPQQQAPAQPQAPAQQQAQAQTQAQVQSHPQQQLPLQQQVIMHKPTGPQGVLLQFFEELDGLVQKWVSRLRDPEAHEAFKMDFGMGLAGAAEGEPAEVDKNNKRKRRQRPRDPKAPKKPKTTYFLFMDDCRKNIIEHIKQNVPPETSQKDITRALAKIWYDEVTEVERKKYKDLYKTMQDKHKSEQKLYKNAKDNGQDFNPGNLQEYIRQHGFSSTDSDPNDQDAGIVGFDDNSMLASPSAKSSKKKKKTHKKRKDK